MDYQNRAGVRFGGGGVAGYQETNAARRERLRQLALETIDLSKDPYFMKNHLGTFECRLCLTTHANDGSYLAHTQGKKHQTNLARRAAMESRRGAQASTAAQPAAVSQSQIQVRKNIVKIGRPGYKVTKIRDPETGQLGLRFQLKFPDIATNVNPRYRIMSAFEQKVEVPDRNYQYMVIAAEPYESVAFKIDAREIDDSPGRFWTYWDAPTYTIQLFFR
ncbi:zinc finger protein Sap62 [Schizosaccharomyces japonicus yFS275]|uniref:Zinc finger protein Sap62 n=1 Tax=Schizosaccharomyces japonicus (strain yFS275 / FY16936) TaxID=402676 RepID=B6JVT0_SCHJY|nr:zinc finger protein Sap62 [Schizosaccharomyces japonicus yFS275]EEB05481.2 zinc finger protein Sap62 [Schizosaccharomyces japonicus yFS275]